MTISFLLCSVCAFLPLNIVGLSASVTTRMLFDMPKKSQRIPSSTSGSGDVIYPSNMSFLADSNVPFPAKVSLDKKYTRVSSQSVTVRYVEMEDVDNAITMILDEYGPQSKRNEGSQSKPIPVQWIEDALSSYERFGFRMFVKVGLDQRVNRRIDGNRKESFMNMPDHNLILCESTNSKELLGIAEISIQPNLPSRTSPPFVYPMVVKEFIASSNNQRELVPYISNVLVRPDCRGIGIGKILMAACEGRARSMGIYDKVALHVDANLKTGSVAQKLYQKLGFKCMGSSNKGLEKYEWMDFSSTFESDVIFIDDMPFLYMVKDI